MHASFKQMDFRAPEYDESLPFNSLIDGVALVHKEGRLRQLPFQTSSRQLIVGRFLLNLGLLMSPLYTMFASTVSIYVDVKSVTYSTIAFSYPVIYLILAFVVIEQVCRQHIYYRMLQHGFLMKFQESSIWNSLSIPLFLTTNLTTFMLVYYGASKPLNFNDKYFIAQTVVVQTLQLLGFYLSTIWFQASTTVTLHEYSTQSDIEIARQFMNDLTLVHETQIQEIAEKLLVVYDKTKCRYPLISIASLDLVGLFSLYVHCCPSSLERMKAELDEVRVDWTRILVREPPSVPPPSWLTWSLRFWSSRFWASKLFTTRFMFVDEDTDGAFCSLMRFLTLSSWIGWLLLVTFLELASRV